MSGWKEMTEAERSCQAELVAGVETAEKLQTLPVGEAALLTGRDTCREYEVPSKGRF